MYLLVRLLKGFPKPLTYKIPAHLKNKNLVGQVIKVPLKDKILPALVIGKQTKKPKDCSYKIKEAIELEKFPNDPNYYEFIKKISDFYFTKPLLFHQRIRNFLLKPIAINKRSHPFDYAQGERQSNKNSFNKINLTKEQQDVVNYMQKFIVEPKYVPTLLHGVTGSGKTEIYKKLIIKAFENNKTIILLLPEVTLSLQFQNLLKKQLPPNIPILGFHSASKEKEKKELWNFLLLNKPMLIVGVHLPILLPMSNLGLIIVDEEHETGFQEKKHPKINSKEMAIWRANFYKIPILLGSATPSLNSLYNVKKNDWKFFKLKNRFSGQFPKITQVSLNFKNQKRRKNFWVSNELQDAIKQRLEKKEQIIIYINRRGFSFFVQCKRCGFIFQCPNCSVSLTLHTKKTPQNKIYNELMCHYCDYKIIYPTHCPECKTEEKNLLKKGIGTQQAVKILNELFPQAKIERADLDTTSKKRLWQNTVEAFEKGEIDILVGTQAITKGYHFPNVTLVGILWADLNLHFPVFNATETTLQKLIQVAGRTGRGEKESTVIVQTMQDHEIFNFLDEKKYLQFCDGELQIRNSINYPPFVRLIQVELKNTDSNKLDIDAEKLVSLLHETNKKQNLNLQVLGPSRPIVYKIQKTESRQIFIKSKTFKQINLLFKEINIENFDSSIFIVPTQ